MAYNFFSCVNVAKYINQTYFNCGNLFICLLLPTVCHILKLILIRTGMILLMLNYSYGSPSSKQV